jgi:anaerobic selenocysteine-containing dehydrogenase
MLKLKSYTGVLTTELVQSPAGFGLGRVPTKLKPISTTTSICGFCATGCQLKMHLDHEGSAINLTPETNYPVNLGMACPKGWEALSVLDSPDRGKMPLLRDKITGNRSEISWQDAATLFTDRLKKIKAEAGDEAVAFLSTGQIALEEMALLGCLFKFGMEFVHCDANTRQCMATAVTAYKQSFGFDAPPYSYHDFEESDVIILVGSNLCIAHPIMWQRVMLNKRQPQIIVIDPRKTETAMCATQHLQIKPKGDLSLFHALAYCLIRDGKIQQDFIEAHTENFTDYSEKVMALNLESLAEIAGITLSTIESLAALIADPSKRVSFWWTMGVNQSHEGVRTAQAIIALALMTGNIGKPGTGANSITGQCNAMGSRLFSNTTSMVAGHDFSNLEHRKKVAEILQIPIEQIHDRPSFAYDEIFDAIEAGKIKALWIIGTNPFHSWIDSNKLKRIREKLDFVIVQDMYFNTESAVIADLYLPAAGWGEKDGCLINSERRIGTIKQVKQPPGQALSDFRIFRLLAEAWGCGDLFTQWREPESAFYLLRDLTINRPCDITGIDSYKMIDDCGGIQWPYKKGSKSTKRLFSDGKFFTPNQRAIFHFTQSIPTPELADEIYPFFLLTGRGTSSQWHTQSRTAKSAILRKLSPERPYLEINSDDAKENNFTDGQAVTVESKRGKMTAYIFIATTMRRGEVFLPMHYPAVNQLTHPSFDPYSRQPNYKAAAVRIL